MRVALFTSSFLPVVGGMEYAVHYLAEALLDRGVDVTVIARRQPVSDNFAHRYPLIRYGLPFRGGHRFRIDHVTALLALAQLHGEKPLDIANIHSVSVAPQLSLGFFLSKRIPVVMTPHGEDVQRVPEIGYGLRLDARWDRIIRNHLCAADAVTAISNSIARELDWINQEKITNVPNGIHTRVFGCGHATHLQEILGLSPNTRIILSVGRNHIKKGYEYGIRAVAELFRTHDTENWHYVLIGRGVSSLSSLVVELSMQKRVSLIETVSPERLRLYYNSSHIFFSPSIVEGLSLVSIEAMACGLPLVVTDVPGNEDIVSENRCGLIVRNKNVSEMAQGLRALTSNDSLRMSLGELARARAITYDWQEIAGRYIAVYENVLKKRHRNSA